ncbi:hypothetical protein [Streptomyces sp. cmx-4-25]|uniref:hypothetical protein n=1 Tax=Streptomyces sp. cmx-4-25 TaxID=2790933 RepID=UPI00397FFAE9
MAGHRTGFWTGYGDEGAYSGDRVSTDGLVRWDDRGNRTGVLRPPAPHHRVAGVSAVNVSPSAVHAVYWPGVPLVETGPGGTLRVRTLPVSDPSGLAIDADRLLLLGGTERGTGTAARTHAVHHLRLTADKAVLVGREELAFPNGDLVGRHARPVCRGPNVFLHTRRTLRQWWVPTSRRLCTPCGSGDVRHPPAHPVAPGAL